VLPLKSQNLEEYNKMGLPKIKNNIKVYPSNSNLKRRQELLDSITKSDTNLPDSVLHDDLDAGMLEYVKNNFIVISNGVQIPIIPKILTIQRWGQVCETWEYSDDDYNVELPFIALIRRPDVQPGTNPIVQRTIPNRRSFFYSSQLTWDGNKMGGNVYKIPQPVAVDISFDVIIVCTDIRDLSRFNKVVLQKFSSRQDYTLVKGHYIPIIMESVEDNTPMDAIESRRFYIQTYKFSMLGFLIDSDEFEVLPAISRVFLVDEVISKIPISKKRYIKSAEITVSSLMGNGEQTVFSVGEIIGVLFNVSINGLVQQQNVNFYHVSGTSKIVFFVPPPDNSNVIVVYFAGKNSIITDVYGRVIQVSTEYYEYDGSSLLFNTNNPIESVINLTINGLIEEEEIGFVKSGLDEITLLSSPIVGSTIGITYLY
jgi:hypothetical protein